MDMPTDEELLSLMPEVMRDEFSYAAKACSNATGDQVEPSIFRVVLNAVALEYARAVLSRWGCAAGSITFHESQISEVVRIDNQGFHYRGELIEDAGQAHRLMITFLQRHTSMHPEVVERENAQFEPVIPTDEELHQLWLDLYSFHDGPSSGDVAEIARAALTRWGNLNTKQENN